MQLLAGIDLIMYRNKAQGQKGNELDQGSHA